jgi:hypothetical protein
MADADSTGDLQGRLSPASAQDAAGGDASMLAVDTLFICIHIFIYMYTHICTKFCFCKNNKRTIIILR